MMRRMTMSKLATTILVVGWSILLVMTGGFVVHLVDGHIYLTSKEAASPVEISINFPSSSGDIDQEVVTIEEKEYYSDDDYADGDAYQEELLDESPEMEVVHVSEAMQIRQFKKRLPATRKYTRAETSTPSKKIVVWSWKGGDSVNKHQLQQTVEVVLDRLPHVLNTPHMVSLLMETAATESRRGYWMVQKNNGPARGIFQMEKATIKDTLSWLKKYHRDVYTAVQVFYEKKQTQEWNYTHNVPWQIAMASSYYWRMVGSDIYSVISTRTDRAKLYKLVWNTTKGKATLAKYHRDSKNWA